MKSRDSSKSTHPFIPRGLHVIQYNCPQPFVKWLWCYPGLSFHQQIRSPFRRLQRFFRHPRSSRFQWKKEQGEIEQLPWILVISGTFPLEVTSMEKRKDDTYKELSIILHELSQDQKYMLSLSIEIYPVYALAGESKNHLNLKFG